MTDNWIGTNLAALMCALENLAVNTLGIHSPWAPSTEAAALMFELYEKNRGKFSRIKGMEAFASMYVDELNAFFIKHGRGPIWNIPLGPSDIGFASISDIIAKWATPGLLMPIEGVDGNMYQGFTIPQSGHDIIEYPGLGVFARIHTKDGSIMHVGCPASPVTNEASLTWQVMNALLQGGKVHYGYDELRVPVAMNLGETNPNLDFIVGSSVAGYPIVALEQRVRFGMDHKGYELHDVTMGAISLGLPEYFIIDRDFIAFTLVPGVNFPVGLYHIPLRSFTPAEPTSRMDDWY